MQDTFDRHRAVVIGGSMAGLLAARVLSEHPETSKLPGCSQRGKICAIHVLRDLMPKETEAG